jgi:hypothetical protein
MCPNLMQKKWPLAARIPECERSDVNSSFTFSGRSSGIISKRKKAGQQLRSNIPAVSAEPPIDELSYYIEGENLPNLTGKIIKIGKIVLYL